jgi:hypothetical protein
MSSRECVIVPAAAKETRLWSTDASPKDKAVWVDAPDDVVKTGFAIPLRTARWICAAVVVIVCALVVWPVSTSGL